MRFIPRPVVVGFTNGIAVLIASTQIRDFFGLDVDTVPGDFLPRLKVLATQFWTWSPAATALAAGTLVIIRQTLKAEFFRALAHPVRIRLLEVLVSKGPTSVQDLQRQLGIEQPIVSQQLARLRASGIVTASRQGTIIEYEATDPMLKNLLVVAKQILNRRLTGVRALLKELERDPHSRSGSQCPA